MPRPFEGFRVLDLTHVLAGPFCAYQLAVLGADVIKIEPTDEPDIARGRGPVDVLNAEGLGLNYLVQGANKRALALDLKTPMGREILLDLVESADVLIENYRSSALASLGLDEAALRGRNPRLIHCSMTGYGGDNGRSEVNAYDNVIQAASGLVHRTSCPGGGPIKPGASLVDYAAGYNAAFAIASALLRRERHGGGQRIDCSMFETALILMAPEAAASLYEGDASSKPKEAGLGLYGTKDGLLMLGAFNVRQNRRLWTALERPEFAAISDWNGIWKAAGAMRTALTSLLLERTAAEWEILLHEIGVPAERVRTLDEALRMPHLAERSFLAGLEPLGCGESRVEVPVAAFSYATGGPSIDRPPPRHGQDTVEICRELGLTDETIAALRDKGVIKC